MDSWDDSGVRCEDSSAEDSEEDSDVNSQPGKDSKLDSEKDVGFVFWGEFFCGRILEL